MRSIIAILALVLVACGGGYDSMDALIEGTGCEVETRQSVIYAEEAYCKDGRLLAYFGTPEAQENYLSIVAQFGITVEDEGDGWAVLTNVPG